jgi:cell division protein FtsQ
MPRVARSPRNSVKDRPARLKLLLRRQKRLLRPAAWGVFGLTVIMIGVIAVHSAAPSGTLATLRERLGGATGFTGLRVTDVVIEGRANTPEPLLRAALSVNKGDPILGFSVEMARQRIESLSWVEQATVERQLPGTVVVNLKERRPFAVWQNQGKFALIDRNGQLVADQNVSEFRTLPLVVGVGAPAGAAVLIDALTDRPELQKRVVAAVRVGERRWNLRLTSGTRAMRSPRSIACCSFSSSTSCWIVRWPRSTCGWAIASCCVHARTRRSQHERHVATRADAAPGL